MREDKKKENSNLTPWVYFFAHRNDFVSNSSHSCSALTFCLVPCGKQQTILILVGKVDPCFITIISSLLHRRLCSSPFQNENGVTLHTQASLNFKFLFGSFWPLWRQLLFRIILYVKKFNNASTEENFHFC